MGAPDYVGHMGDADGWFRYPAGRSAEHVNAGIFTSAAATASEPGGPAAAPRRRLPRSPT